MKTNTIQKIYTHAGGRAVRLSADEQLRRSVFACLLWEDTFYEDGEDIAARIVRLAKAVKPEFVAELADEARNRYHLRHVPLVLASVVAETDKSRIADLLGRVIRRADEIPEFVTIHAKRLGVDTNVIKPLMTRQIGKGLGNAFRRFDEYQLAKYDKRGAPVRLRDVLIMCHPKPENEAQAELWGRLVDESLKTPKTWETQVSGGRGKKETFEELLAEERLGYLALLRTLRTMLSSGVDRMQVKEAILARKGANKVFPFRYIAAAKACPQLEPELDKAFLAALGEQTPWEGRTYVLVDVSDSMNKPISRKSAMTFMDGAAALAAMIPGETRMFSFSWEVLEVAPRKGMAAVDAIKHSQEHRGTYLGKAVKMMNGLMEPDERLVVLTDEQAHDEVPAPAVERAYMVNVNTNENGVGQGRWRRINGFSEHALRYIGAVEKGGHDLVDTPGSKDKAA